MPKVKANNITINYDQQGTGEPLILIPYLAADYACYAFQVAEYAKHFTCISVDLRGTGESDKPEGVYSTELFADDVAAFMQAVGIPKAHVSGLSLGAATGMWLAAKYPDKVKSLSLHSGWTEDGPLPQDRGRRVAGDGQSVGKRARDGDPGHLPVVLHTRAVCRQAGVHPVLGRVCAGPARATCCAAFLQESNAVIAHDAEAQLGRITAPTQITFGATTW